MYGESNTSARYQLLHTIINFKASKRIHYREYTNNRQAIGWIKKKLSRAPGIEKVRLFSKSNKGKEEFINIGHQKWVCHDFTDFQSKLNCYFGAALARRIV